ncbi:CotH kinase family protein [Bacillus sp. KH172YL63]|uniref:CotH kinase family protein n=1 Tax=Bacillus sp. KH172YL63 TaxID=2709784 RepID=UPI0013E466C1|nr:CotH kinase family protein [Bacillus sp. KH172YL63]BCB02962.1 inner spore coat protein H [Bacillus sp. KH172YL63]
MVVSLPSYDLHFEESDLKKLQRDVSSKKPVPAKIRMEEDVHDIAIRYRGSYTRKLEKKSYQVEFVQNRGADYPEEIHLNAEAYDPAHFRNKLSLDFMRDIGIHSPESKHVFLTMDGAPLGLYLQLESVNEQYLTKRNLPFGPIYYAVNNKADFSQKKKRGLTSGYVRKVGKMKDDHHLISFIRTINTPSRLSFQKEIPKVLNVENYLRWLAGAVCTMNNDGFTHNYALYRDGEKKQFNIIPWDYDATFGRKVNGGVMEWDYLPLTGKSKNHLTAQLMKSSSFRNMYKKILEELLETIFTVNYLEEKVMTLHTALRPYVLMDPHFQDNIDAYDEEPAFIFQFIKDRNAFLKRELMFLK